MPTLIALLLLLTGALAPQDSRSSLDQADGLRNAGKLARAAEAYEAITRTTPESGEAWFYLGYVRHALGDFEGAVAAGQRAAESPAFRATALYNVACAESLRGQLDAALEALEGALAAGFMDLDLMESDTDLQALRAVHTLPGPAAHEFQFKRAPNGVTVPYFVQEPTGYDPERSYPALLVFAPGSGTRTADWAIEEFFGDPAARAGWIVVHVTQPDRGWNTHPTHHALEDLLKRLKKSYRIEGSAFHFLGVLGGAQPALTYSLMSERYAASMTLVSCPSWASYNESDWRRWRGMGVHLIEGEHATTLAATRAAHAKFEEYGVDTHLTVVPDGDSRVESLRGAALRQALATVLPAPAKAAD